MAGIQSTRFQVSLSERRPPQPFSTEADMPGSDPLWRLEILPPFMWRLTLLLGVDIARTDTTRSNYIPPSVVTLRRRYSEVVRRETLLLSLRRQSDPSAPTMRTSHPVRRRHRDSAISLSAISLSTPDRSIPTSPRPLRM